MRSKRIKIILIGLLFIGISISLWFYIYHKPKVTSPIPNYADSISCIDYINVRNEIFKKYLTGGNVDANGLFDIRTIGLKIPNYLVSFTCSETNPNTLFTSFEIEDSVLFNSWTKDLVKKHDFTTSTYNKFTCLVDSKNHFIFSTNKNKKRLLIAIGNSISAKSLENIHASIFEGHNLMTADNERIKQIRSNSKLGFVWIDKGKKLVSESFFTLYIKDEKLVLEGNLFLHPDYQFPEENNNINETKSSYFYTNFGASSLLSDFFNSINTNKIEKLSSLNLDSIQKYGLQKIEFSLLNPQIKQDTFITYSYDDNFNKVIEKEIISHTLPEFEASFSFNKKGVFPYLINTKSIKTVNDTLIFTAFPFAKVFASEKETTIKLSTKKDVIPVENFSDCFLVVNTIFNEIDSTYLKRLPFEKKWLKDKSFLIEGKQRGDSTFLKASISF